MLENQDSFRPALAAQFDWLAKAMNATQAGLIFIELNSGRILFANQAAYRLFQDILTPDHRLDYEKFKVFDANENLLSLEQTPRMRAARGERFFGEEMIIRTENREIIFLVSSEIMSGNSGYPDVAALTFQDITSHRRALRRLEESEWNFRNIFDQAGSGMALIGMSGEVLGANQRLCQIFGYSPEEFVHLSFRDVTYPEDLAADQAQADRLIRGEISSYSLEKRYVRKDGSVIWASLSVSCFQSSLSSEQKFIAVVDDINERKQLESQLRVAKEQAESANRLKSAFLANVSHEIRTPLGAILGFSHLLHDERLSVEMRENYLDIIERNGQALTRIIDDVLDLSKVEAGRLDIETVPVSISELLKEVASLFKDKAESKNLEFIVEPVTRTPDLLLTDPIRLRQILLNIVGNAIKFTSYGSVRIYVELEPDRAGKGVDEVVFRVEDTGIGLSSEQAERLFNPFIQADSSTTRQFGGTGLGLALSRRLARALGGDVWLDDCVEGQGCTFAVSLPAHVQESVEETLRVPGIEGDVSKKKFTSGERLKGIRVLLVEDSADNRSLVRIYLNREGAALEEAVDGRRGVEMALQNSYDVILMDIQMPVLDGYAATRELRNQGYERPIVALTAHALKEEKLKALESGCDDHLTKPLNPELLIETVALFSRTPV